MLACSGKQAVSDAVQNLYEVFGRYKRSIVEGCDHCVFPQDNALIHSKPLRKLSPLELEKYGRKALTTWGDQDDLRHFLPRLFELMTEGERISRLIDAPILTGKLRYAQWQHWPNHEREALHQFFTCYWERVLAEYPCQLESADDALCTIANAVDDIVPYMEFWQKQSDAPPIAHLAEFITDEVDRYCRKKKLGNAFWDDREDQVAQVVRWFQSADLSKRVESLFFDFEEKELQLATALSVASGMLEIVRNAQLP